MKNVSYHGLLLGYAGVGFHTAVWQMLHTAVCVENMQLWDFDSKSGNPRPGKLGNTYEGILRGFYGVFMYL